MIWTCSNPSIVHTLTKCSCYFQIGYLLAGPFPPKSLLLSLWSFLWRATIHQCVLLSTSPFVLMFILVYNALQQFMSLCTQRVFLQNPCLVRFVTPICYVRNISKIHIYSIIIPILRFSYHGLLHVSFDLAKGIVNQWLPLFTLSYVNV